MPYGSNIITSSGAGFCFAKGGDAYQNSQIGAVNMTQNYSNGVWRTKMKRRILASIGVLVLVAALVPAVAFSAEGTVTCTVSAELVSLTVNPGTVTYGALAVGTTKNTGQYDATNNSYGMATPQTQTITNNGNVQEDFRIKTSDADGLTAWTLSETADSDVFTHAWNWGSTQYDGTGAITFTKWTASDSYVVSGVDVPSSGQRYLELQIGMPTSVTDYGNHTITVTVEASLG